VTGGGSTLKVLGALSDASLGQAVTKDDRTLGRLAWHLATGPTRRLRQAGLKVPGVYGPAREEWTAYGMQAPFL